MASHAGGRLARVLLVVAALWAAVGWALGWFGS